jgi:hypothetical protein
MVALLHPVRCGVNFYDVRGDFNESEYYAYDDVGNMGRIGDE